MESTIQRIIYARPRMLAPGDPAPDLTLFGVDAEPVRILALVPLLLVFYLYDWTDT